MFDKYLDTAQDQDSVPRFRNVRKVFLKTIYVASAGFPVRDGTTEVGGPTMSASFRISLALLTFHMTQKKYKYIYAQRLGFAQAS